MERSFPTRLGDMLPEELKMYFDYVWDWTSTEEDTNFSFQV